MQSVINKHKAGTFRSEAEVRALESEGKYQVIRVPGKLVAAIKPPRRFKARLVACGNFLHREKTRKSSTLDRTDLYCSNLDIFSLRIQIAVGVQKGWRAASIDVKTAFLTAPFQAGRTTGPEPKQKLILVKVPRAVVLAGFAEPNSYIQVDKALYGLQESPHSWSLDRDVKLRKLRWKGENGAERRLVACASDTCIWRVLTPEGKAIGTLGVYVDDLLFMVEPAELEATIAAIRGVWECSVTEYADNPKGLSFCGIQILQQGKNLWIHQEKFIDELAKRYSSLKPSPYMPDFKSLPEVETPTAADVRTAQKIIGELTWIAGRTRPDISFSVNRMSRMTTNMPRFAYACGEQIIRFLLQTRQLRMKYSSEMVFPEDMVEALAQTRHPALLESFCDASFAQQDSRSQSGVMVMLAGQAIAWLSSQQPFIAMSTAEAEMIACTEGVALTQAVEPLVAELLDQDVCWSLYNDSVACSAILSYPSGSWRTRHLRLRSKALQEMISDDLLHIHHIPGKYMTADLLTKPLTPARIQELWEYTGLDTSKVDMPRRSRTKSALELAPVVRVAIVSLLVTPVSAQGPQEPWTYRGLGIKAVLCMLALIGLLTVAYFRKYRPRRLRADGHPVIVEIQQGSHNPNWPAFVAGDAAGNVSPEHLEEASPEHPEDVSPEHPEEPGFFLELPCVTCNSRSHSDPENPTSPLESVGESSVDGRPITQDPETPHPESTNQQGGLDVGNVQEEQAGGASHVIWDLLYLCGRYVIEALGTGSPEVLWLRETAPRARLATASAYARARNWNPPPAHHEESEETDSGMTLFNSTSVSEVGMPWDVIHAQAQHSPLYRGSFVENAFETWLMCSRPWSSNLGEFPYLDCLFDLEIIVFQVAVEWYYNRTPQSRRTEGGTEENDADRVLEIFQRLVHTGIIILDPQGVPWSGPYIPHTGLTPPPDVAMLGLVTGGQGQPLPFVARQSAEDGEEGQVDTGARSSHEPPHPEVDPPSRDVDLDRQMEVVPSSPDTGARSSNEPFREVGVTSQSNTAEDEVSEEDSESSGGPSVTSSQAEEHNQHVAQAVFLLWLEGYDFDWTQLTEGQQNAYHGMVGRYLQD